jgi:predicted transcriptional regulator
MSDDVGTTPNLIELTSTIVRAYVSNNSIQATELPNLMKSVFVTLSDLAGGVGRSSLPIGLKPAVTIRKSVTPDYVICLEDGKKLTMLKRYLRSRYKLTPDEYRSKWGLPADYPMVAPNYSVRRSDFAKKIGLGRLPKSTKRRRRA